MFRVLWMVLSKMEAEIMAKVKGEEEMGWR